MKTITLLKTLTIGMALIILAGLGLVGYKIAESTTKSKSPEIIQSVFNLHFPETVNTSLACGEYLCLLTVGHETGPRVVIVDPEKGRVRAVVSLKDQ